jgi:hypothetical protein
VDGRRPAAAAATAATSFGMTWCVIAFGVTIDAPAIRVGPCDVLGWVIY